MDIVVSRPSIMYQRKLANVVLLGTKKIYVSWLNMI